MRTILGALALIAPSLVAAQPFNTFIPFTKNCLEVAALVRCTEGAAELITECAEEGIDTLAVIVKQTPNENIPGVAVIGKRALRCSVPIGDVFLCPLEDGVEGSAVVHIEQTGFFFPIEKSPEDCGRGTPLAL